MKPKGIYTEAFTNSNLQLTKLDVCDIRNEKVIAHITYDYDIILLAGGHIPTQNNFFNQIKLKDLSIIFVASFKNFIKIIKVKYI